jgi:hypothetical protein
VLLLAWLGIHRCPWAIEEICVAISRVGIPTEAIIISLCVHYDLQVLQYVPFQKAETNNSRLGLEQA